MDAKSQVELIKQAAEHLLDAELLEENGWKKEDIEFLQKVVNQDFEIKFK